ncbi:MAG: hypothetical protein Kow0090_06220 [Myxococcota bacterium]
MLLLKHIELAKKIYFEEGEIVYVISNSTLETIGQFLMHKKIITPVDLNTGLQNQRREGGSLISALIRMGKLTREQAVQSLSDQAIARIVDASCWNGGRYYFFPNERAPASRMPYGFNVLDVMLESLREGFGIDRLRSIFARYKDAWLKLTDEFDAAGGKFRLNKEELKAANLLDGKPITVFGYLKRCAKEGVVPLVSLRTLYLFIQTEGVVVETIDADLPFDADISASPPKPIYPAVKGIGGAPSEATVPDFAAVTQPPEYAQMVTIQEGANPELLELLEKLESRNHFQRLGVKPTTSDEEVKEIYIEYMKKLHPDKFPTDSPDRLVCERIIALITQSYQMLKTESARKEYAATVELGVDEDGVDISYVFEAEQYFSRGMQFLKNNNPSKALEFFSKSSELIPDDKSFKAYTALSEHLLSPKDGSMEQRALEELLKLNEGVENPDTFAFLACGRIYKLRGDMEKAREMFLKCLQHDRKNIDASRELRLIEMRTQKKK